MADFVTLTDDGEGNLSETGTGASTGTINYDTGEVTVTLATAPGVGAEIFVDYDTTKYQTFTKAIPDDDSLTSDGGDYYLTNRVDLDVQGPISITLEELTRLFYYVAPTVLVLRTVTRPLEIDGPVYLKAGLTITMKI